MGILGGEKRRCVLIRYISQTFCPLTTTHARIPFRDGRGGAGALFSERFFFVVAVAVGTLLCLTESDWWWLRVADGVW